jgi:hypothetical protein
MLAVKDNLEATNEFKPNLSSFDQEETSMFGSIQLYGFINTNPLQSQILEGALQLSELLKLCEFSPNDKWTLLYRGTRDSFASDDSHSRCNGHSNTLTILKAKGSSNIFGGFTSVSWDGSSGYKSDSNAFIFSLTNKDNQPVKMKIDQNEHKFAIYCDYRFGPIFGHGADIHISNNANTTVKSCSRLGDILKIYFYTVILYKNLKICLN